MKYIEGLIEKKRNKVLSVLVHLRPDIVKMVCDEEPFFNCAIHMAAKYNNVDFMKEMIQIDKSVINLKNGTYYLFVQETTNGR